MKKIIIAVLSLAIAVSMSGCNKTPEAAVGPETTTAVSETESIHDFEYTRKEISEDENGKTIAYYNENSLSGNLIVRWEGYDADGNLIWYDTYEYDEWENPVKESNFDGEGNLTSYAISEYNAEGKITLFVYYLGDGTVDNKTTYEYRENGDISKECYYIGEDTISEYVVYTYDENDNITDCTHYDEGDNVVYKTEWKYDENGNTTEEIATDEDGYQVISSFEYDDNGNIRYSITKDSEGVISDEVYYHENGDIDSEWYYDNGVVATVYTHLYDDEYVLQVDYYHNDKPVRTELCDEEGYVLKEIVDFGANYYLYKYGEDGYKSEGAFCNAVNDEVLWVNKYEYDEWGYCTKEECYVDGKLTEYTTFEYDEYGNEIKSSVYGADGTLKTYRENEYDYYGNLISFKDYNAGRTPAV